MDKLFAIDARARQEGMNQAERHDLRNQQAPDLLAQLRAQVLDTQKKVLPKSLAGKAASSDSIYEALVEAYQMAENDLFQIIEQLDPGDLIYDRHYGI